MRIWKTLKTDWWSYLSMIIVLGGVIYCLIQGLYILILIYMLCLVPKFLYHTYLYGTIDGDGKGQAAEEWDTPTQRKNFKTAVKEGLLPKWNIWWWPF